ncbi:hypothetical protein LCGC14_2258930 [marine sediment metagenome]|uniref:Uncharacterized protein n=1 Tax=marine sediment metagenome TaxID=412755 RepID=A0A0F9FCS4_9ZZZZ
MKTFKFINHFLTLVFCSYSFGQQQSVVGNTDKIVEIIIDLNDQKGIDPLQIEKYNALKSGEFFRIRIDNVNTFLFDVSILNEDIDTAAELPASLLDLVDFGGIKTSLGNSNSISSVVKKFVANAPTATVQYFDIDKVQSDESLTTYFSGLKSSAKSKFNELTMLSAEVDAVFEQAESFQNTMSTVDRNVFGAVPTKVDIMGVINSFDQTKKSIVETKELLLEEDSEFLQVLEINKVSVSKNKDLKASAAEIKKVYEALRKASDNLIAQLSAENYGKFSSVLIAVLNNLDFRYTSLPIQRFSDVNELIIHLKPRDKNTKLSAYSTLLRIPDIEKSFWGVSTGFYATGNPENNYSVVERVENGQTVYDFLEEETASFELGINTMIRYGQRIGKVLDSPMFWHFGFGAGLSIDEKFKPRLMAGTGLAFGRKNKIFVDVGVIHMYYNTISKAYTKRANSVLPENFIVNATKINGYVSLGYLISF